jgi:hypothetical protein
MAIERTIPLHRIEAIPRPIPDRVPLSVRLVLVLALTVVNSALYLLLNTHSASAAIALPPTAIDAWVGWHAWTIWPYWLLLVLGPAMALGLRDRPILEATLRAYAVALAINLAIWSVFPTAIVRDVLPSGLDAGTHAAWALLYALDGPGNCFPSGHVTIPLVVAAGFGAQYPKTRWLLWPLLVLLLPSVLSTGQHYSWDVLGGMATAGAGLAMAGRPLWRRRHAT